MWFCSWLRNGKPSWTRDRRRTQRAAHRPAGFCPRLESLEDRDVPSTLTVTSNLDSGTGSLRAEIAAAQSGDIIDLSNLSGQTITLTSGELAINKNLTIHGPSAPLAPVTISSDIAGGFWSRLFEVDGATTNVALSNLNLIDDVCNGQGGAIWNGGTLTLSACNLSNNFNYIGSGGGLAEGGAIFNDGTLTVSNSTLDNNTAGGTQPDPPGGGTGLVPPSPGDGGAIYNAGTLTVSNSTLDNNTATDTGDPIGSDGGGIFNAPGASVTITGSTLSGNFAVQAGGGIYNGGTMTLSGSTVSLNGASVGEAETGGGIYNAKRASLTVTGASTVLNNTATLGADIYNLGQERISKDSTVGIKK
jgi:hypothetical protein